MMIFKILKWIGIIAAVLFGFGVVVAIWVMIEFFIEENEIFISLFMRNIEKNRHEQNAQETLPFHCVEINEKCPTPELPCKLCKEYKKQKGSSELSDGGDRQ